MLDTHELGFIKHISTPEPTVVQQRPIDQIDKYLLIRKIGQGTFSKVFLSIDKETHKTYAVKKIKLRTMLKMPDGANQLDREIRLMKFLNHDNILKLYDVFLSGDHEYAYLVLGYADKGSVLNLLQKGKLTYDSIRSIIKQVAIALSYMHSKGFVHQDVKPANILVDSTGKAILGDFGISHSINSASMVVGSPAFQAPEALDDDDELPPIDGQCPQIKEDVWALGITLYQMLFDQLPYTGENLYNIVKNIKENELVIPKASFPVPEDLIRGILEIDPHKRLNLDQILSHPFIKDADNFITDFNIRTTTLIPTDFEKNREINFIDFVKCDNNFKFSQIAAELKASALKLVRSSDSFMGHSYNPRMARKRIPQPIPKGFNSLQGPMPENLLQAGAHIPRTFTPKPIRHYRF
ncbi:CAMK family protein kinase [Histomonas meleagridis]|uniref:CAMK family protein kinase n=1 Tax=Histomonas meleagridis TaxID=135588 RepID=UPI00355A35F0|nr:CAMK family protein kinase [Histomonas meleagridis]KAH0806450.1 CAMK family protein kinase [Histomonas meleagridis]